MSVKRYSVYGFADIQLSRDGNFITYVSYQKLEAQLDEYKERFQLVAEQSIRDCEKAEDLKKQLEAIRKVAIEMHTENCGVCMDGSCKYCNAFRAAIGEKDNG